jgi:hypothetical protein
MSLRASVHPARLKELRYVVGIEHYAPPDPIDGQLPLAYQCSNRVPADTEPPPRFHNVEPLHV